MPLKPTGAGKIGLYPSTDIRTHVLLYNFDIDGAELKAEHKRFLETQVVPLLIQRGSTAIKGLCSRSGSRAHNQMLSERRADAVHRFLSLTSSRNANIFLIKGLGETAAAEAGQRDGLEDQHYRAVELIVSPTPMPGKIPARKDRPKEHSPKHVSWRKVDVWLTAKTLDIFAAKKLRGNLGFYKGCGQADAWDFSVSSMGLSVPVKGKPPLFGGSIDTRGAPFHYNPEVFNPVQLWRNKSVHMTMHGHTVKITVKDGLPRSMGADYQPLRITAGVNVQGKDVIFKLEAKDPELGGLQGVGSIRDPRARMIKEVSCA